MSGRIDQRLADLGIELPDAPAPAANYVPYWVSGNLLFVAGQGPSWNGEMRHQGTVGKDISLEDAQQAARVVALNLIAQARQACDGDLDRITRVVKLGAFVNCEADFTDHPKVINGASDLMVEVFGDLGRHARFAVGLPRLPFNISVEIDAVFEIEVP